MLNPRLNETITIDFITSLPNGTAVDADSTPTVEVFEDSTDTAMGSPTIAKRTSKTGNYRITIAVTAANGFETGGKCYNVIVAATINAVGPCKAVVERFQVRPGVESVNVIQVMGEDAEATTGPINANLTHVLGDPAEPATDPVEADVTKIMGSTFIAADLVPTISIAGAVADTTPAAGNFDGSSGLSATDNFYVGAVLAFKEGTLKGIARRITGYTGSTKNLVFATPFPIAPANGDDFAIFGRID
jgi:hypothetical protein